MFAKMPEGFNNPNAPDFPGLNSNGGPTTYSQFNSVENINSSTDYQNNINNNLQTNNNTPEYPDPNLINKATENTKSSFLDNIMCNMSFLQSYFDIETDDIIKRLLASLIPCNKNFINLVEKKPDLYGILDLYNINFHHSKCRLFNPIYSWSRSRRLFSKIYTNCRRCYLWYRILFTFNC